MAAPEADIRNKTFIVTGANSGIGRATAQALVSRGARVVLAVRDEEKGRKAASQLGGRSEVRKLDLADLRSIRSFAETWEGPIDSLINNAGISVPHCESTRDGFELQFGTNHLGPFALTNLLLPHISRRVVTVASQAASMGRIPFDDLNWKRTPYKEFSAYANSKLANLLFTAGLQSRLSERGSAVTATSAHPGLVATNIYAKARGFARWMVRLAQSAEMGALDVLFALRSDLPANAYVGPKHFMHMRGSPQILKLPKAARNSELADRLWTVSEQLTGVSFVLQPAVRSAQSAQ